MNFATAWFCMSIDKMSWKLKSSACSVRCCYDALSPVKNAVQLTGAKAATIDKGADSKHEQQGRNESTLTRKQHQNNNKPDAGEQGTSDIQALQMQHNFQSRKGVSAPGNTYRPTALESKNVTRNPDYVQESHSVPGER
jgi:hypothetical protein